MTDIRQTIERIEAIGEIKLGMISPYARDMAHVNGDLFWASVDGAELGGTGILTSCTGHGATTEEAIENLWTKLTTYDDHDKYVIIDSYKDSRSAHKWVEGIGWTKVNEAFEHDAWDSLARNQK